MKEENIGALCIKRLELIDQLEQGILNKESFIMENYQMLKTISRVGFEISSVDEGIMKYHYFNTLAKKKMLEADLLEYRDPAAASKVKSEAFDLYLKKDRITLNLLEYVNYNDIEAYYIQMNSKHLEGTIYEIVFLNHDRVILHSKDRKILYKLRTSGCFSENWRESKIQTYVNTKVY